MAKKPRGAFSDETKEMVLARSKGRCEICGTTAQYGQFHHRSPRRMGGTSRTELGGADNALYLHPICHERVERNRSDAYEAGWLVRVNGVPSDTPVRLWDGWHTLGSDGSVTAASPK